MSEPLVVSVRELGEKLGLGRSLAYRMVSEGQVPSIRLGRRILVPVRSLERMLLVNAGSGKQNHERK